MCTPGAIENIPYYGIANMNINKTIVVSIVWVGYSIKVIAGIFIVVGFQTRLSALALAVFTLITAFNYHDIGGTIFMKEMTMLGGLLVLAAAGPGRFSVDKR